MCMLRWPDNATALQTSSPYPGSRTRFPLVLPGIILTVFPDLWFGLVALRVRTTPATEPGGRPEQAQKGRELHVRSRTSWGLGLTYHLLDSHPRQGPSHLLAGVTNLWVLEGSWREMTPYSHPHGSKAQNQPLPDLEPPLLYLRRVTFLPLGMSDWDQKKGLSS